MQYTAGALAKMSGVTPRTLRHYDQIGLLVPRRAPGSHYRQYGSAEVARLQQILFFRELGLPLGEIQVVLSGPAFSPIDALQGHLAALREKRCQIDRLIDTVEKTIQHTKGEIAMQDHEKFEAFKKQMIDKNEADYGAEVREKYGDAEVDASNAKMMNMTQEEYAAFTALGEKLNATLREAKKTGDPAGPLAQEAAALHKEWLGYTWPKYSPEAHMGLVQMYVDDPRFTAYYEKITPGGAAFLRDAVTIYCGKGK